MSIISVGTIQDEHCEAWTLIIRPDRADLIDPETGRLQSTFPRGIAKTVKFNTIDPRCLLVRGGTLWWEPCRTLSRG